MSNCDLERVVADGEEVTFLPASKEHIGNNLPRDKSDSPYLSREDLLKLDAEQPVWRRVRLLLLIGFWVLWLGLLTAAIIIIVLTPKCPPTPKLSFWQNKVGYWLDPFAYADSNGDLIGDIKGLINKLSYIKDSVGAGFVILGSIVSGHYTNAHNSLGLAENFTSMDPALGTMSDFRSLIKNYHRNGLEVIVSLDFNAISVTHEWVKKPKFLQPEISGEVFSRDGSPPVVDVAGRSYYSVGNKKTVDLNLTSEDVILQIEKITKYWLNEGVDGILLSNAAFYVEDPDAQEQSFRTTQMNMSNGWFNAYPSKQIFTNLSVEFVRKIRSIIDFVSVSTGRERLLAVDSGDAGFGLTDSTEDAIKFLGTKDAPAAHMVISRQFVKNRGWKVKPQVSQWESITTKSYISISNDSKFSLGLTVATPTDQRHRDVTALAAILLLPGTPIVYYGTELGIELSPVLTPPNSLYPRGKTPFPNLSEQDSTLVCQLPMPWDRSGVGFTPAAPNVSFVEFLNKYGIAETVDSALAFGRGDTPFKLVRDLIKLREKPSIKWGEFELLNLGENDSSSKIEIFTRKAVGFPAFVVAMIKEAPSYGAVYNFASVCESVIPRLTYPSRPELKLDEAIDGSRVFLKTDKEPAIYVFECA